MKFGITSHNSALGIWPTELAREAEARDFHSIWVGEHTHLPFAEGSRDWFFYDHREPATSRAAGRSCGVECKDPRFAHAMNVEEMSPLISLAAAAGMTKRIRLGTAICQVLQHDLIDLAKQLATLDVVSQGRLELGIGTGWREAEFAAHRPDVPWHRRWTAMRERVEAMRSLWRDDIAAYQGEFETLPPLAMFPKPIRRSIPVLVGGEGAIARSHAVTYGDRWLPVEHSMLEENMWTSSGEPAFRSLLRRFEAELDAKGRERASVQVWLQLFALPSEKLVEAYERLGIECLHIAYYPRTERVTRDDMLYLMDRVAKLQEVFGDSTDISAQ